LEYEEHETVWSGSGNPVSEEATDLGQYDYLELVGVSGRTSVGVERRLLQVALLRQNRQAGLEPRQVLFDK
jgi:hypothetical protein